MAYSTDVVGLSDAATGFHLWSEIYNVELKDIFTVQDEITKRIVGTTAIKLTRLERDRVLRKPTANLAAYEYVLRGRADLTNPTRAANDDARALFQRAIGDVGHRAVGIAVGDIADRDLLRIKVEAQVNPVVGVPGQQPLFERDALQLFDIAQVSDRAEPACGAHCRFDAGAETMTSTVHRPDDVSTRQRTTRWCISHITCVNLHRHARA